MISQKISQFSLHIKILACLQVYIGKKLIKSTQPTSQRTLMELQK